MDFRSAIPTTSQAPDHLLGAPSAEPGSIASLAPSTQLAATVLQGAARDHNLSRSLNNDQLPLTPPNVDETTSSGASHATDSKSVALQLSAVGFLMAFFESLQTLGGDFKAQLDELRAIYQKLKADSDRLAYIESESQHKLGYKVAEATAEQGKTAHKAAMISAGLTIAGSLLVPVLGGLKALSKASPLQKLKNVFNKNTAKPVTQEAAIKVNKPTTSNTAKESDLEISQNKLKIAEAKASKAADKASKAREQRKSEEFNLFNTGAQTFGRISESSGNIVSANAELTNKLSESQKQKDEADSNLSSTRGRKHSDASQTASSAIDRLLSTQASMDEQAHQFRQKNA